MQAKHYPVVVFEIFKKKNMNETSVKTSSCLAITEKRQHHNNNNNTRPGGCVGIFFQLFDWNRRFAKKKLFSRKLLPPARARQASKKFAGDEKMPKIKPQLTIEENNEVFFPSMKKNVKSEQSHDTKTPSLVARLMGLESMPTIPQDKSEKPAISCSYDIKEEKVVNFNRSGDDLSLEKGNTTRLESRPQKIRKTNSYERRAVTRFCTESLQIKNVLSRSRQHPKLLSPEKSPRISSSRSSYRTSRLIDAATKILEPGLQATNRAKCALTYRSSSMHFTQKDELLMEEIVVMSPHLMNDESGCDRTVRESIIGQTSCNLLGVVDSQQKFDKHPFVYHTLNLNNASTQEQDDEVVFGRTPDRPAREKDNKCSKRKSQPQEGSVQCHSTKLLHNNEPAKHRAQTQNQVFSCRDKTPPRLKSSNSKCKRVSSNGSKDFVALNRSISGQTAHMRISTKVDNSTLETRKKSSNRRDESLSQVRSTARKRRTVGDNRLVKSTMTKQTNARCDVITSGEQTSGNSHTCISNRLARQEKEVDKAYNTLENNVNSFTFSSSATQKSRISAQKEKKNVHRDLHSKHTVSNENESNGQKLSFKADELGVLLQQKLKELSYQEDELTMDHKRSTAVILQELISALTTGQPIPQEYHMFHRDIVFQSKAKTGGNVVESSCNGDHLSPGSVLEDPFSNGCCFSSSMDDNSVSGHRVPFDSMDCSSDQLPPLAYPEGELLDLATSSNKDESCYELVSMLLNQISTTLDTFKSIDLGIGLSGSKLMHAKAVILNAEIMFTQQNSNGEKHLLVIDILDTLAKALSRDLNPHLGFEETKEDNNRMKGFLFDCLIEYLDSKCCQYSYSRRLLPCMNSDMLIWEVEIELRKWKQIEGMIHDELLELEIHHSLEKWMDFHTEAFETGIKIDVDILQALMEEVVLDFL